MTSPWCPFLREGDCGYRTAPEPDALLCFCRHDAGEWDSDPVVQAVDAFLDSSTLVLGSREP